MLSCAGFGCSAPYYYIKRYSTSVVRMQNLGYREQYIYRVTKKVDFIKGVRKDIRLVEAECVEAVKQSEIARILPQYNISAVIICCQLLVGRYPRSGYIRSRFQTSFNGSISLPQAIFLLKWVAVTSIFASSIRSLRFSSSIPLDHHARILFVAPYKRHQFYSQFYVIFSSIHSIPIYLISIVLIFFSYA
jgi:hypothetical protein